MTNKKEDMQRMTKMVVTNFKELMRHSSDEGLKWRASKRDLVELSHLVWETNLMRDERGMPLSFSVIVDRIFKVLNTSVPKSPTAVYANLLKRKNIRSCSVTERYMYLLQENTVKDPMRLDIKRMKLG